MAAESAIVMNNVTKVFDRDTNRPVTALENVSLAINDNEFFTLLGPSGCGKTTLLRLIAGFDEPTRGEILLFGKNLRGLPPQKRPVNTVFQHYALFPHMTVAENVGFGLKMLGKDEREITRTVEEMLELVKMREFGHRKPTQLSGGQQQRVALARALAPRPKVLLLDEPLSALDLKLRQEMRGELKTLQRETGITFVFVTHDQVEALTMSDRIAVMSLGQLQQKGTPNEIYEQPVNRFVADFIGETNFLEATVSGIDGKVARCSIGEGMELLVDEVGNKKLGDRVTLALRPEKISLRPASEAARGGLVGEVRDSVYVGTDTTYHIALDGGVEIIVRGQNSIMGESRFKVGNRVELRVARGAARILMD
ncbi:MAG: ABC transporter ATP-binding protein [Deltaproteobacteria bacterium]|nr:ABC transporter ATP-binding protein [Deltaproteobacteria bacterium]